MNLEDKLISENKTKWLDIGSGGKLTPGFELIDIFPVEAIDEKFQSKYHRLDIANAIEDVLVKLGKFDLIRMQHTFEHLTFEEGERALINCAKLLEENGYLLITVPDLKIHIQKYLNNEYKDWESFAGWANKRIPRDAPNSAYFSVFAHSMTYEPHKWCYDYEGLEYQVKRTNEFTNIAELKPTDELANEPFTHNRVEEDVCLIAQKK
jgi:predicted SAM-dependent methyltransferase